MFTNNKLTSLLSTKKILFVLWAFIASFGAYFCMYAFRKPFASAAFEGQDVMGFNLKVLLVLSQVLGYMCSKFIGIKIISELKENKRIFLIISLILIAEFALFLFALLPVSVKPLALFMNGLPLGMVWGVIFSFLEGRRLTEIIAAGLSVSAIVSSGLLKSLGVLMIENFGINEFYMPFFIGFIFLPIFFLFIWMLKLIPKPSAEDVYLKSERVAMTAMDRRLMLRNYGFGILLLVLSYALFSVYRDFRDNFSVEIWGDLLQKSEYSIFTKTEIPIALIVIVLTIIIVCFKDNFSGLLYAYLLIFVGFALIGISGSLFKEQLISSYMWMVLNGLGLYMAYVPFQIVIYERLVALFKMNGNAGFLMYLSDSVGYLGAVAILFFKEFFELKISWLDFFLNMAYIISGLGLVLLSISLVFFNHKYNKLKKVKAFQLKA